MFCPLGHGKSWVALSTRPELSSLAGAWPPDREPIHQNLTPAGMKLGLSSWSRFQGKPNSVCLFQLEPHLEKLASGTDPLVMGADLQITRF